MPAMDATLSANASIELRAQAARAVAAVIDGHSLDAALVSARATLPANTHPLLQQIAYGVLRDWRLLHALTQSLTQRPPKPTLLAALLAVGLYQLRSLHQAEHAVVDNTVSATARLRLQRARGMVNAVLRRYQRERAALEARLPADPAITCSHPDWMLEQLRQDWPQHWQALLQANQQPAPMWLRVNAQRGSTAAYLQRLRDAGMPAQPSAHAPQALCLQQAVPVLQLPGFAEGDVSVQDAAAQLAAGLFSAAQGKRLRVLDACAAPGGKTAQLLETCPNIELTALDIDSERLQRVQENLERLNLTATLKTGDAAQPQDWWDGYAFDHILLDAPCSGTGVIRRHPDIKWLRRADDIPAFKQRQQQLLAALWPLLAPGGTLVYATCSVFAAEGDEVIQAQSQTLADCAIAPMGGAGWGIPTRHGIRIASGSNGMDGFYYAKLTRLAAPRQGA